MKFTSDNVIEFVIVNEDQVPDKPIIIGNIYKPVYIPKVGDEITVHNIFKDIDYTFQVTDVRMSVSNHEFISDQIVTVYLSWLPAKA